MLNYPIEPAPFLQDYVIPSLAAELFECPTIVPEHFECGASPENAVRDEIAGARRSSETSYQFGQAMVVAKTISNKKD